MSDIREFKYRAFVSYSHTDTYWAKWLHTGLEKLTIDKDLVGRETDMGRVPKSLRPIFRDRDEFTAGYTLTDQTIAALDTSAALVVVCSTKAAQSHYVNEEVRLFKSKQSNRPVIPVIVAGRPGSAEAECFPPALRFGVRADGTITNQPAELLLAADLRDNGDGQKLALAKVAARLLGLGTDEVFRRAERERRRRQRVRTGIGVVLLSLLIVGAFFSWLSYHQQQTLAEIEALVAKYTPVAEAQGALPDTKPSLTEAITAIAQGATNDPRYKKALDLLKAGRPAEAEPLLKAVAEEKAARVTRDSKEAAAAFRHLGAIAGLGDPRRSREAYARALDLDPGDTESLYWSGSLSLLAGDLNVGERFLNQLMVESVNTNSRRGLYRAHLRLGEVSMARGDLAGSIEHQKKAMAITESAATSEPANAEWQSDYSVSLEKIGDVLQAQGNLSGALESYKASLAIRERLATTDPQNTGWQRDLSVSHNKIGDVFRAQDNLPAALESYMASFTIRERLAKASPGNAGAQRDLSVSKEKIGNVLLAQGKFAAALEHYIGSLNIRRRLVNADNKNAGWQHDVSVSLENIGDVLQAQGNLSGALESYKASLAIRERLATTDPQNTGWQRDLSVSHDKVGDVFRAQDNLPAALESYMASFTIRERLAKASPGNAGWQADFAMIHAGLGQFHAALGNNAEALRLFKAGREILAPLAQRSGNMRWVRQVWKFDRDIATLQK